MPLPGDATHCDIRSILEIAGATSTDTRQGSGVEQSGGGRRRIFVGLSDAGEAEPYIGTAGGREKFAREF